MSKQSDDLQKDIKNLLQQILDKQNEISNNTRKV